MSLGFVLGVVVGVVSTLWLRRHPAPDALTGLPARRAADAALASLGPRDAVVMIDLDTLKATNDASGHAAGDAVLRTFAAYLAEEVRGGDTVARWGGDEFVVVLRGGADNAAAVVERIRKHSPTPFSAGIGQSLEAADGALLKAKRGGGGLVLEA